MPQKPILQIDFTQEDASENILPRSPLLSSQELAWDGVLVQHHQQPAWEMPEYVLPQHTLTIHHCSHSSASERVLDGKLQTEQLYVGDVALIPANVSHKKLWRGDCAFTLLMLDPVHVAHIADEVVDSSRIEMLPHFAKADPLIHQIGLALKSELESNQPSSRLYIDSLITVLVAHLIRHYSTISKVPVSTSGLSQHQLEQTIAYIDAHLTQELNLAKLADVVGVSKFGVGK